MSIDTNTIPNDEPVSALVLCDKGCEQFVAAELESKYNIIAKTANRVCMFSATIAQLGYITFTIQGGIRILRLATINDVTFEGSFKVEVLDITKLSDSQKLAIDIGSQIYTRTKQPVDVKAPKHKLLHIITEDATYFGFDLWHDALFKREYKLFNSSTALRASVAFNMLTAGEYNASKTILDPFCGSGTILIEAALFGSNTSAREYQTEKLVLPLTENQKDTYAKSKQKPAPIYGYDIQTKAIDSTKKNAKIAGIGEYLNLGRCEIDNIDMKFKEGFVDCIITAPPLFANHDTHKVHRIYQQFFTRVPKILNENGIIIILTNDFEAAQQHVSPDEFSIEQYPIWMGQEGLYIIKLKRK